MPSWSRSHALRRWTASLTAAVSVAALLVAVGPAPATLAGPGGKAAGWQREPAQSLTLVTGDRVRVTVRADGRSTATVTPAPRAGGLRPSFRITRRGDHLYVVPQDMTSLLPNRLDPALFDVTTLLEQGYGDADRGSTPLIVTYGDAAVALPATRRTRTLASVDGAAVEATKADAPRFGRALGDLARRPTATSTRVGGPLAGVEKVWLDRRVEVTDEASAAQIGAPAVWARGYDGAGVRVAVLDTGVDTTHPDLDDRVAASQDFTGSESSTDRFGHGTHVASIVAGTGAASQGRQRGVAHGATLLNGKVLGDDGFGYASSVIAGMEWASTQQDADVVNMSLGFPPGSYESGPVTEAVDRLTEQDDTLFVIAAGNSGCSPCVSGPGDAESALTVGAVDDDDDRIADFSSRGPVPRTFGLKPDITAPGVAIVAARAAGTELGDPVDDDHTAMSGTSMATPHVAAAAALLLQADHDLTPGLVKARLMGTAESTLEASVYTEGAGRVDVARAVDATMAATPASIGYGDFAWPHDVRDPVRRTLTYRNTGEAPVTLRLTDDIRDRDGDAVPADTVTVSPETLTVPAGGEATADVVLDTSAGGAGLFGGTVTARSGDAVVARTPVGFHKQEQMFELHVDGRARDGRDAVGGFQVLDVEKGEVFAQRYWSADSSDECTDAEWALSTCVRVPRGTYSVLGMVFTMPSWAPSQVHVAVALHTSLVGDPEVAVTKDTTLTLDARDAEEVEIDTPNHDARANLGGAVDLGMYRTPEHGEGVADRIINMPGSQVEERFFVQPTRKVRLGEFAALTRWRLEEPDIRLRTIGRHKVRLDPFYYDPTFFSDVISQFPRLDGRRRLRVVDAGTASTNETSRTDLRGALALVRRSDDISVPDQSNNAAAAGASLVAVYNDRPGADPSPGETGVRLQVPTVRLTQAEGLALIAAMRRGRLTVEAEGEPDSAFLYDLAYLEERRVPDRLRYVADTSRLASVRRHFHAQLTEEMTFGEMSFAWLEWDTLLTGTVYPLTGTPRTRVDYHVGDPRISWDHQVMTPDPRSGAPWPAPPVTLTTMHPPAFTTYQPGRRTEDHWFAQPVVTGPNPHVPVARAGDVMQVAMAAMVGSDGKYATMCTNAESSDFVSAFSIHVGDELLAETDCVPQGTLAVPAKRSEYRIDYATDNAMPWARMSTSTRSTWTFHSERPTGDEPAVLPLIVADYDVPLDLYNRLDTRGHGHRTAAIGLDVGYQDGAVRPRIDDVRLAVSYDDGKRWRDVRLERTGEGRYVASLDTRASKHAEFASLRLRADDRAGNTLRQEVIRAFALSGR